MVFSSYLFVFLFLPVFLTLYRLLPPKLRNAFLLAASLLFYAFGDAAGTPVLLVSVVGNFAFGLAIDRAREAERTSARGWLVGGLVFNLALLGWFKYAGFLTRNLDALGAALGHPALVPIADAALPLGISFFAFQGMSYLIDVHRGTIRATPSLVGFATYKTFFPQLIAGPIVRYRDVANELRSRTTSDAQLYEGTLRFVIGFCKKVLIADTVARTADAIFGLPAAELTFAIAWLGVLAYAIQIYFDFSAYSDMAIGLALIMGFRFPENFNYPYVSRSIREFWRRWHMTLSSWFRDYVYVPLGGNRLGRARTYANLLIVFALTGLWHGAAWTFVFWGLWHGAFIALERLVGFEQRRVAAPLRHVYALLVVLVGWVLFRAPNATFALDMLAAMSGFASASGTRPFMEFLDAQQALALGAGIAFSMPLHPWLREKLAPRAALWAGAPAFVALFAVASCKVLSGAYSPFLYFRF
ncbi:MAG: MBOAT family protein [Rhodanobacteraceae bacterium]